MSDVLPLPPAAALPLATAADAASPSIGTGRVLRIEFTGSGSEYFRIWIVNLLLTIVSLGLYYPWAKARRLRYFYANTVVGEHALDFHGDPKRMLRGFLLVGLLLMLYSVAGNVSPTAGLVAFVIVAVVWPALLRASMRFKLANTSWRGMRLRFTGDPAGAYRAILPIFIPGGVLIAATAGIDPQQADAATRHAAGLALIATAIAFTAVAPWVFWMLKRYQHNHYAYGTLHTTLSAGPVPFYAVALKTCAVALLALAVVVLAVGLIAAASFSSLGNGGRGVLIAIGVIAGYLVTLLVVMPYATSRTQNLVWCRTIGRDIRFDSTLAFGALLALTLRNALLMLVTLGLYWPFARIAVARMRLTAISIVTSGNPDLLFDARRRGGDDATGDAAGDLFGIDIGL